MRKWSLIFYFIGMGFVLWIACTSIVFSFTNPTKTQTEVFLHIPRSFVLDFRAVSNNKFYEKGDSQEEHLQAEVSDVRGEIVELKIAENVYLNFPIQQLNRAVENHKTDYNIKR